MQLFILETKYLRLDGLGESSSPFLHRGKILKKRKKTFSQRGRDLTAGTNRSFIRRFEANL
jgi:hypothetical protein